MKNKVALVWDAERAGREIDAVWEKREAVERKRVDYDGTLLKLLLEAKTNYDGPFKEFVETYTHISLTTAKRTLRIADGRGEEVRAAERERQQRHRAGGGVTSSCHALDAALPEVPLDEAECIRLAEMPEAEFEKHVEAVVAKARTEIAPDEVIETPAIVPAPDAAFVIGKGTLKEASLKDIAGLGIDYNTTIPFADDIDLDTYDTIGRAAEVLRIIHDAMVEPLAEPLAARRKVENDRAIAEAQAEREAKAAAELARLAWEVDHPTEAREKAKPTAEAVETERTEWGAMRREFDLDQFLIEADHDFLRRWYKEHNTIWPGHRAEKLPARDLERSRKRRRRVQVPNLDHIPVTPTLRKLYDATQDTDDNTDEATLYKAQCALAAFIKVDPPKSQAPETRCDRAVDPIDAAYSERWAAYDDWQDDNASYIAAEREVNDKIWRIDEPEEAAEHDKEQAERDALTAKRIVQEAKNPAKAKAKAHKQAQHDAMEGDMDEAKEAAKEDGERWGDQKDEWIENWIADNWDEHTEAEFETDFNEQWERDHGNAFPNSKYGRA